MSAPAKTFKLALLTSAILLAACNNDKDEPVNAPANLLLSNNQLAVVDANAPGDGVAILGGITGLNSGDTLVSIDRRPRNGFLYGLGYNATAGMVQLYAIHVDTTGGTNVSPKATPIGTAGSFVGSDGVTPVAIGNNSPSTTFDIDFNPFVDRLRVVSSLGENFRINPNTGALIDGNSNANGTQMDGPTNVMGAPTPALATAYTNSLFNTAFTTQYTVTGSALNIQNPPNNGTLISVGSLPPTLTGLRALDILPDITVGQSNAAASGLAHAIVQSGSSSAISRIDLSNGRVVDTSVLPGITNAIGLALQKPPAASVVALTGDGTGLLRFSADAPGTVVMQQINTASLVSGDQLVGIDFRPATGQLFAIGVNATNDTATVYRLDPQDGSLVAVGSPVSVTGDLPDPATADYGVDFNPVPDRIRVVTSNGLNLRFNPVDGTVVNDAPLTANSAAAGAGGAGYTNSVGNTTVTTLYVIDRSSGNLLIQNPPNNGVLSAPQRISLNGSPLTIAAVGGFDIPADVRVTTSNAAVASGSGFAALTVGSSTGLYKINLVNGAATLIGTIGSGTTAIRGLALGQTHFR